ncbi:hypothetical protein [Winogradskya humida]|uniref:LPXTG-motif cell wall-anchored protein n=1 Tax=Winogradskya humida TaxID=113566 RepID=A0ABQ3ZGY4_9ACTN|nr:hypothetical protein [Actinoplanes humidus]GIE17774.1 hypothetical protein Ahu01nite_008760 [Actinoplanes humidus]
MRYRPVRMACAALAAAVMALTIPAPAMAAAADITMTPRHNGTLMGVGRSGTEIGMGTGTTVHTTADTVVQDPKWTWSTAGEHGYVYPHENPTCSRSGTEVVCQGSAKLALTAAKPYDMGIGIFLSPTSDAKPGETVRVTVTLSGSNIEPVSTVNTYRVVENVNFAAVGTNPAERIWIGPGKTAEVPFSAAVDGTYTIRRAVLTFDDPTAKLVLAPPKPAELYSNCVYDPGFALPKQCVFDQDLAPGRTYTVRLPMTVRADVEHFGELRFGFTWDTVTEHKPVTGTHGSGGVLRIDSAPDSTGPPVEQVDQDYWKYANNSSSKWIVADEATTGKTDTAAYAKSPIRGKKGDVVTATVGVHNAGQFIVRPSGIEFALPPGTTATGLPEHCFSYNKATVFCSISDVFTLPGETVTFDIGLRIDKLITTAKGTVRAGLVQYESYDDQANNGTTLVLNPPPSPSPATSSPVATSPPVATTPPVVADEGGSGGGGLPVTGPATTLIVLTGVVLIAGGVLLVRRRRTRFEA